MVEKMYLRNGQGVRLGDSIFSREINAVLKDATIAFFREKVRLSRDDKFIDVTPEELGIKKDSLGYYLNFLEELDE